MTMTVMAFMIMILSLINRFGGDNHDYYVIAMKIMMRWESELTFASAAFLG